MNGEGMIDGISKRFASTFQRKDELAVAGVLMCIAFCSKTHGLSRKLKTAFFCTVLMEDKPQHIFSENSHLVQTLIAQNIHNYMNF